MKPSLDVYQPMGNQILCRVKIKSQTEGGVFLPKDMKDRWLRVVKTGPLAEVVKEGDVVLLGEAMYIEISFDGNPYLQVAEFGVVGRVPAGVDVNEFSTVTTT